MQRHQPIEEQDSVTSSLSSMIPPSVRIEGCTPPSESSLEGELFNVPRGSIDSTLEFRPSDLDDAFDEHDDETTTLLTGAEAPTQVVILPASLPPTSATPCGRTIPTVIIEEGSTEAPFVPSRSAVRRSISSPAPPPTRRADYPKDIP
eukprot:maker-scaffold149_size310270-snap-gene-1.8 protein:Tk01268 transcript:maker-scaffold149_size310270-snap-gene-1.8-mRNA-1 annotation:"hypothetical protein EPUS_04676"